MSSAYRHFNTMCWPVPGERLGEISHMLSWGTPTKDELLVCASVITAFTQLVRLPEERRNEIIRELRKGPSVGIDRAAKGSSDADA